MLLDKIRDYLRKIFSTHKTVEDITKRNKEGMELKENEAKLQSVLSSLYEAFIIVYDRDGKVTTLWGTPEMDERYGIRAVDVVGRSISEFVPSEQVAQRQAEISRVFDSGEKMIVEYKVIVPSGNFWQEASLSPMKDTSEKIVAVVGFVRDITERKQIEEAHYNSQERLRTLSKATFEGIVLHKNGVFLDCNEQFADIVGYGRDELIGIDGLTLVHPDDRALARNRITIGNEDPYEIRLLCKDGSTKFGEVHGQMMLINGERLRVTAFRDISERKIMEKELMESELRLREMAENINSVFWMEDTDGNLLYTSPAYEQVWGRTCQSFYENPKSWLDAIHPDDRKRVADSFTKWKLSGEYTEEFRIIRPDGEIRWIYDRGYPIKNEKGEAYRIARMAEDITERKKMEEVLRQSENLKSIGTITAGISHEFNNLLAIISGNVQLLERTYKDQGELMDALRTIKRATDDGAEISSKMLAFTKTEQDTKELVSSDIRDLIRQSIDFTKPRWKNMAQAKNINYQMDTEGMKRTSSILCNPTELREVFINIINNALDAMPDGGRISFSTWSNDCTAFVNISDTGKGMSGEVKKKVFDPFFTTRRPEGSGLGMSTSYGIIARHGGKIEIESEVGKVSTPIFGLFPNSFRALITSYPQTSGRAMSHNTRSKGSIFTSSIASVLLPTVLTL